MPNSTVERIGPKSSDPNIRKDQEHRKEEYQPHAPANARPFCHPKHTVHIAPDPNTGIVKGIVEVREVRSIPDFVADGQGDLSRSATATNPNWIVDGG